MIPVTNDIITIFRNQGRLQNYKNQLYNLKVTWITDRYNQVKDENAKKDFFRKMKKDYEKFSFAELLDNNNRFVYDSVLCSNDFKQFDKLKRHYQIANENKPFNNKISKYEEWFEDLNEDMQSFSIKTLQNNFKNENKGQLDDNQLIFYQNILNSLDSNTYHINKKITHLKNEFETYKQNPESVNFEDKLNELLNEYMKDSKELSELKNECSNLKLKIDDKNTIIQENTVKIDRLNSQNNHLTKKNDYLIREYKNKSPLKRIFSRK